MQARVKPSARFGIVQALSGLEFTKKDWRAVPAGKEAEALRNQYLECRELVVEEVPEEVKEYTIEEILSNPNELIPGEVELEAELADWDNLPDVEEVSDTEFLIAADVESGGELPEEVVEKPKAKKLTPYIEELPAIEEHAGIEKKPTKKKR